MSNKKNLLCPKSLEQLTFLYDTVQLIYKYFDWWLPNKLDIILDDINAYMRTNPEFDTMINIKSLTGFITNWHYSGWYPVEVFNAETEKWYENSKYPYEGLQ